MQKEIKEIQRQIEIAAIVYEKPSFYSEFDLAEIFKTSPTTIRRDLKALRTIGADIHSRKGKLQTSFNLRDLNVLISKYYSLNSAFEVRNIKILRDIFKNKTLSIFVNIIKAINEKLEIQVDFRIPSSSEELKKVLSPVYLLPAQKSFYMIAYDNHELKFYRIETITGIKILRTKQVKDAPEISEIFKNSWGIYTGGEEMEVKLKFARGWDEYLEHKFWIENQKISYVNDGVILDIKVKQSYEFISWVMGWGDEVEILSPLKLKREVICRAKSILDKYA